MHCDMTSGRDWSATHLRRVIVVRSIRLAFHGQVSRSQTGCLDPDSGAWQLGRFSMIAWGRDEPWLRPSGFEVVASKCLTVDRAAPGTTSRQRLRDAARQRVTAGVGVLRCDLRQKWSSNDVENDVEMWPKWSSSDVDVEMWPKWSSNPQCVFGMESGQHPTDSRSKGCAHSRWRNPRRIGPYGKLAGRLLAERPAVPPISVLYWDSEFQKVWLKQNLNC